MHLQLVTGLCTAPSSIIGVGKVLKCAMYQHIRRAPLHVDMSLSVIGLPDTNAGKDMHRVKQGAMACVQRDNASSFAVPTESTPRACSHCEAQ